MKPVFDKIVASALLASASWALLAVAPATAQAQAQVQDLETPPPVSRDYKPAKTPWGDPDLRGIWPIDYLNGLVLERNAQYGNRVFLTDEEFAAAQARQDALRARYENDSKDDKIGRGHWDEAGEATRRTSLIVDPPNGRLPPRTAEGDRLASKMRSSWRKGQNFDAPTDFDSWDRCITRGLPASMLPMHYNNGIRIFQAPGLVAIQLEMIHETRIVPTDGREAAPRQISNWMGESRGRWEDGNTLVVETTNFRPGPSATNTVTVGSPPENDTPVSPQARLVEWFTMTDADTISYKMTWTDPVIFTAPWTVQFDWRRNDEYGMFEYACHEGNVQIRNYITASRATRGEGRESDQ